MSDEEKQKGKFEFLFGKYTFPNIVVGLLLLIFGLGLVIGTFLGVELEKLALLASIFGGLSVHFVKQDK